MSDLPSNLFQAVESIVNRVVDSTPIDLTITGKIAKLQNVEVGEYKVSYQGTIFSAYSIDPMTTYKLGEEIYVLVPKGDFSTKKVILGRAAFNDKVSYADRQAMQNQWRVRGPNWLSQEWYWRNTDGTFRVDDRNAEIVVAEQVDDGSIEHPAANWRDYVFYRDNIPEQSELNYTAERRVKTNIAEQRPGQTPTGQAALGIVDAELQQWGRQLEHIIVKADFETKFLSTHTSGEYGILVEAFVDNPKYGVAGYSSAEPQYNIMSFKLGFGDFNGAPYSFAQKTPQRAVFSVPKGVIKGLARVSLFQNDGWKTDIQPVTINGDGEVDPNGRQYTFDPAIAHKVLERNNVFASNIEIYWCEPVNLSDRLFWIKMEAPKGTSLFNTPGTAEQEASWITSLPLRARLMYGAEDITSRDSCKFVWFRQKYSALSHYAEDLEPDEFGNVWSAYLPDGEQGWAPIAQLNKSSVEDPYLGENASYKLGTLNGATFVEDNYFQDSLLVPITEVPWRWKYMCVCYYNSGGGNLDEIKRSSHNSALIWDSETVRNISSIHDFELPMAEIGNNLSDIYLRVRNNTLPWDGEIPFDRFNPAANDPERDWYCRWWWSSGETYNAMEVPNDPEQQRYHKGRRRIDHLLLNEPITFKAQIYGKRLPAGITPQEQVADAAQLWPDPTEIDNPDMTAEYGYEEIANIERAIIPTDGSMVHIEFVGQRHHYYNSDGSIGLAELAERQYDVYARITPRDESLAVFSVEWLAPDRTPLVNLSAEEIIAGKGYTSLGGMTRDAWMSVPTQGNDRRSLHYKVRDTYDIDLVGEGDNTFWLRVTFLNGAVHEEPCIISYSKADSSGSQGSGWNAQICPCNATPALDGDNAVVGYTPWARKIEGHPRPLVVRGDWNPPSKPNAPTTGYTQNTDYRLFLRPFITRNGQSIESLPERDRYTYKVFWDVRYPNIKANSSPRADASNGSFLALSHAGISGRSLSDLGRDGDLATGTPYQRGLTLPANQLDYQAYTHSLDREGYPYNGTSGSSAQPTYGAIEVKWGNKPNVGGRSFKELNYSFVVKARIEIYYDGVGVASMTAFHGVDTVFENGTTLDYSKFTPNKLKTNWPKEVQYRTNGLAPSLSNEQLYMYYGDPAYTSATAEPLPMTASPTNLTPIIQDVSALNDGMNVTGPYSDSIVYSRTEEGIADVVSFEGFFYAVKEKGSIPVGTVPQRHNNDDPYWRPIKDLTSWKLHPRAFYFFEEMENGALASDILTNTGKWPSGAAVNPDFAEWGSAVFVRPIVYYISQYGNDQINGWDGKSIDLNNEEGTLFAPTIGAGWKHPFTNTFSGVVMGIDKSQLKNDYDADYGGFSKDNISQNPYMTGLYGYQDGHNSFGVMENGTAFFGRADRGGRIVIDGYNAQIYGGISMEGRTGLDADMRNRMRLSFIDFGGVANQMTSDDFDSAAANSEDWNNVAKQYEAYMAGVDQEQYHKTKVYREQVDAVIQNYKNQLELIAGGPTMGLPVDGEGSIVLRSFPTNKDVDALNPSPAYDRWFGNFYNYFAPGIGRENDPTAEDPGVDPLAAKYGGYTSGNTYSTPAIEIGSYKDWVQDENGQRKPEDRMLWRRDKNDPYRRGEQLIRHYTLKHIQREGVANNISKLEIPGFRRFLVTYDGTLYAMNAFIKGNIIGSNIIGSQFFNDEGSFAVTVNGNLGIGKGYGSWTEEVVNNGYGSLWSQYAPTTYNKPVHEYLGSETNKKKDFLDGGFAFYVANDGTVLAQNIHIAGGSLNIGDFHIIGSQASGGYNPGDVVSFGTMYLVGQKGPASPSLAHTALEVWGNIYARGRLANLGPVYLGGSWEKNANHSTSSGSSESTYPTSFNSPISIVPSQGISGSSPDSSPNFPVNIGVWPLYFHMGTGTLTPSQNAVWVSMSHSGATGGSVGDNGYMPGFSLRAGASGSTGPSFISGDGTMAPHVNWRLDQLGMWSDAILFTRRDWTGNPSDTQALSLGTHGLAYFGWGSRTGVSGEVWGFNIRNVAKAAPSFSVETLTDVHIIAGSGQVQRGSGSPDFTSNQIILETRTGQGGSSNRRGAMLSLTGVNNSSDTSPVDRGILSATSVALVARANSRGTSVDQATYNSSLESFILVNGVGFDFSDPVKDPLGKVVDYGGTISGGVNPRGRLWLKGLGVAIDGAAVLGSGAKGVGTLDHVATIRVNRSPNGDGTGWGTPPTGARAPSDLLGTVLLQAEDTIMVAARGTNTQVWFRDIPAEKQFGIYARFA